MSHVERYNGPLRTAYERLESEVPRENKSNILLMALHFANSTVGTEGLCPTLCVLGAALRPARAIPAPDQGVLARAIDAAMNDVADQADGKSAFAHKYSGLYGEKQTQLDDLQFCASVRVYKESSKTCEAPFKFVSKDGKKSL